MKYITSILLLLFSASCFSQNNFNLMATINTESDFFTTDNLCNVYVVKKNELTKYDKTGKLLYKYSNNSFGNITSVDVSNMLRIMVFYRDFLQVVFLDNTLSVTGDAISLEQLGFQQTQLACASHNSGWWIYDQQNFELIRLDQNLAKTQQTGNLSTTLFTTIQPNRLVEYDNKIFLNNPSSGVLIFDVYGTYNKTIALKGALQFQPIGDWIYFMSDNGVKAYNYITTDQKQFDMPAVPYDAFRLEFGTLALHTPRAIYLYASE